MFPKFIEVTRCEEGERWKCSIHVEQIVFFEDHTVWCTSSDDDENVGMIWVEETYEDLQKLIRDTGCLIQKKDPRLDFDHPLTWDNLCKLEMIGEPVFNSNTRRWMLLIDSGNDNGWIELINHAGGHEKWIEHDAMKFPLYRMKK